MSDPDSPMCQKFNFLLPKLKVDEKYPPVGRDEPVLMGGMIGILRIQPWIGFRDILQNVMKPVDSLDDNDKDLDNAKHFFETGRRHVRDIEERHVLVSELERETKQAAIEESERRGLEGGNKGVSKKRTFDEYNMNKPATNSTSITSINETVMYSIRYLLKAVCCNKAGRREVLAMEKLKCSSENMRIVDGAFGDDAPRLVENLEPDCALFYYRRIDSPNLANSTRIPLCSYEFKGPTLHLCCKNVPHFLLPARTATSEARERQTGSHSRDDPQSHEHSSSIYKDGLDEFYVADLLNKVFDPATDWDSVWNMFQTAVESREGASSDAVFPPIAQTAYVVAQVLSQGLLTQAGCSAYYNHDDGIAFELRGTDADGKIIVAVTGVMGPDLTPGNAGMMYGIGKYSYDKISALSDSDLLLQHKKMRDMFRTIADAAAGNPNRSILYPPETSEESKESGADKGSDWEPSQSSGATSYRRHAMLPVDEAEERFQLLSLGERILPNDVEVGNAREGRTDVPRGMVDAFTEIEDAGKDLSLSPVSDSQPELAIPSHAEDYCHLDSTLKTLFTTNNGVLHYGSNSVVLDGVWDGKRAAVKMWCRDSEQSRRALRSEMRTYRTLQTSHTGLLGTAVPDLFLGWDNPEAKSSYSRYVMVVTEYVGMALSRNERGNLIVCDQDRGCFELTRDEVEKVCGAACTTLQMLHDRNIIHGNAVITNLRVARDRSSSVGWKTWWIDLSTARFLEKESGERLKNLDQTDCMSIFRGTTGWN